MIGMLSTHFMQAMLGAFALIAPTVHNLLQVVFTLLYEYSKIKYYSHHQPELVNQFQERKEF